MSFSPTLFPSLLHCLPDCPTFGMQGVISGKMSEFQGSSSQLFDPKGNNGALSHLRLANLGRLGFFWMFLKHPASNMKGEILCNSGLLMIILKKPEVTISPRFGVKQPSFLSCKLFDWSTNLNLKGVWMTQEEKGSICPDIFCQGISTWFAFQIAIRHLDPAGFFVPLAHSHPAYGEYRGMSPAWFSQELRIPRQHDPTKLDIRNGPRLTLKTACDCHVGVSKNRGTPKSSILIGFSIINHPFWGYPYFWTHQCISLIFFSSFFFHAFPPFHRQQMILFYPTGICNWAACIMDFFHWCPLLSTHQRNRSARLKSSGPTAIKASCCPFHHVHPCWLLKSWDVSRNQDTITSSFTFNAFPSSICPYPESHLDCNLWSPWRASILPCHSLSAWKGSASRCLGSSSVNLCALGEIQKWLVYLVWFCDEITHSPRFHHVFTTSRSLNPTLPWGPPSHSTFNLNVTRGPVIAATSLVWLHAVDLSFVIKFL